MIVGIRIRARVDEQSVDERNVSRLESVVVCDGLVRDAARDLY